MKAVVLVGWLAWLAGPGSFTSLAAPEPVAARLYCLSLRFDKAVTRQLGQTFTLELSTIAGDPGNGELAPIFDPELPDHGSFFRMDHPNFGGAALQGEILVDVPPFVDVNLNGFADFFEVALEVPTTVTRGAFRSDLDEGEVVATWSRPAGSATGSCRLRLTGDIFGQLPDFTHAFELLEYQASWTYVRSGSNVSGTITWHKTADATEQWIGPLELSLNPTNQLDELTLAAGVWTNETQSLTFTNSTIFRDLALQSNYFGYFFFSDGLLSTPDEDYPIWVLSLDDPNDSNGNRVPDLTDSPGGSLPQLGIGLAGSAVALQLRGTVGVRYSLEETRSWTNWLPVMEVTLTNASQTLELPRPATNTFWRLRAN
jgi:hypothetical protein